MKKLLLIVGLLLYPHLASAQSQRNPCAYLGSNLSATLANGNCLAVGYYLAGATGVPMPVGGIANAAAPTFTEAKPGYLSFDLSGNLRTVGSATVVGTASNATSGVSSSATNLSTISYNYGYNGATWDQLQVDANKNLLVSSGGSPNFTTSQVVITTASTSVCPSRAGRRVCIITAITGAQQVFCSGSTATTSNGQLIPAVVGANFTANTAAAVNCITTVASQTVSVTETY